LGITTFFQEHTEDPKLFKELEGSLSHSEKPASDNYPESTSLKFTP